MLLAEPTVYTGQRDTSPQRDTLARLAAIHQYWRLRSERRLQRYAWAARHLDDLPNRPPAQR